MKKLLIIPLLMIGVLAFSQCGDVAGFGTAAVHVTYAPWEQGGGAEIGRTGDLNKFSFYTGMDVSSRKELDENKQQMYMMEAKAYGKVGYRIFRIDYILSGSVEQLVGLDTQTGLLLATGIKLLHPLGTKALSIEPMYTINLGWSVQLALHFMLK
jgi:hypothetical protein